MCKFLTYYHACGFAASRRFRTAACIHATDLRRCHDIDGTIVLTSVCRYCSHGERSPCHPAKLRPTPPPSPGSETDEIVWVMESKHSLFHRQEGVVSSDPFAMDRERQASARKLKLQPATEEEPIDHDEDDDTDSPMRTRRLDEDPFGLEGARSSGDSRKSWTLRGLLLKLQSRTGETSLCCMNAEGRTDGWMMEGRVRDDGCESTV